MDLRTLVEARRSLEHLCEVGRSMAKGDARYFVYGEMEQLCGVLSGAHDDRGLIEHVLDLANGKVNLPFYAAGLPQQERADPFNYETGLPQGADPNSYETGEEPCESASPSQKWLFQQWLSRRAEVANILEEVQRAPEKTRRRLKAAESEMALQIWKVPRSRNNDLTLSDDAIFTSFASLLFYVSVLLLSKSQKFRGNLCRCRLSSCQHWFLVKKPVTGRPQRRYCCQEHMLEAHRLGSTKRAQSSRAAARDREQRKRNESRHLHKVFQRPAA